jgi:hypothetical protein
MPILKTTLKKPRYFCKKLNSDIKLKYGTQAMARKNMTSFKITNDDVGIRSLQESNKTPVISGPVMPVKASNPLQKSPENLPLKPIQTDRRSGESHDTQRRQLDRRKADSSVLLDTRSQHDRRTKTGRSDDAEKDNAVTTLRGIDETA